MVNIYTFSGSVEERISLSGKNYFVMTVGDNLTFESQICATSLRKAIDILETIMSGKKYSLDKTYSVTNGYGKVSSRILKEVKK